MSVWVIFRPTAFGHWLETKLRCSQEGQRVLFRRSIEKLDRLVDSRRVQPLLNQLEELAPKQGWRQRRRRLRLERYRAYVAVNDDEARAISEGLRRFPLLVDRRSVETLAGLVTDIGPESDTRLDPSDPWSQSYLGSEQFGGVDAPAAWSIRGGRGDGVAVVLFELGMTYHKDLKDLRCDCERHEYGEQRCERCLSEFGDDKQQQHGVACLGLLAALGKHSGLCHEATFSVCKVVGPSGPDDTIGQTNILNLVSSATKEFAAGSVFVIPIEGRVTTDGPTLPIEAWRFGREMIANAVAKGIHVVQSAGNNGRDISDFVRCSDSGSIVVGAGSPQAPAWWPSSNYGRRVDLHSWGFNVAGLDRNDGYWRFGGSSAAACIVAGVVACLSGVTRAHQLAPRRFTPRRLRRFLKRNGYWPVSGIGPRPDLRRALEVLTGHERLRSVGEDREPNPRPCFGLSRD